MLLISLQQQAISSPRKQFFAMCEVVHFNVDYFRVNMLTQSSFFYFIRLPGAIVTFILPGVYKHTLQLYNIFSSVFLFSQDYSM
jgi:hypothetical protein